MRIKLVHDNGALGFPGNFDPSLQLLSFNQHSYFITTVKTNKQINNAERDIKKERKKIEDKKREERRDRSVPVGLQGLLKTTTLNPRPRISFLRSSGDTL